MSIQKKFLFLMAATAGICWGTYGAFATIMNNYGVSEGAISIIRLWGTVFSFWSYC